MLLLAFQLAESEKRKQKLIKINSTKFCLYDVDPSHLKSKLFRRIIKYHSICSIVHHAKVQKTFKNQPGQCTSSFSCMYVINERGNLYVHRFNKQKHFEYHHTWKANSLRLLSIIQSFISVPYKCIENILEFYRTIKVHATLYIKCTFER